MAFFIFSALQIQGNLLCNNILFYFTINTAGFSNFNLLALAPISKVKIDKSLLDNYNIKKGEIIYINLIKLINSLELCIVAEGVETESQLEFLKKQNINHAQGYLIGKPDLIEKFIL